MKLCCQIVLLMAIISGSFDVIANTIKEKLNVDNIFTNSLGEDNGVLTGEVFGPLVTGSKLDVLSKFIDEAGYTLEECIAVGDGANDISMIESAEYGIAFNAKPALKQIADIIVETRNLTDVLDVILNLNPDNTEEGADMENEVAVEETEVVETTDVVVENQEEQTAEEVEETEEAVEEAVEEVVEEEAEVAEEATEEVAEEEPKAEKPKKAKKSKKNSLPEPDFDLADTMEGVRAQKDEREELIAKIADQYNAEYNRTISPMKGGYTDNYYMQMVQNIRKYKGVREIPRNKGFLNMQIDGSFEDWKNSSVEYKDTRNDIVHRDHDGYGDLHYTNTTGRNDIVCSKVAMDKQNVYFYVETAGPMSSYTDPNWMLLLVDSDTDSETGWEGYDFLINKKLKDTSHTSMMRWNDRKQEWVEIAELNYRQKGNQMEICVPRSLLKAKGKEVTFDFKWADNPQTLENIISLCTDGDAAPNRRFNFRFLWEK